MPRAPFPSMSPGHRDYAAGSQYAVSGSHQCLRGVHEYPASALRSPVIQVSPRMVYRD